MKISNFSYVLPEGLIADKPPEVRGSSRLLVLHKAAGIMTDSRYADIADYLDPGDLLVLNDTRVIKARLRAFKDNGAERELIILEQHGRQDDWHRHNVLYRRKLHAGERLHVGSAIIHVEKILGDGLAIVRSSSNLLDLAETHGQVPLPPYLHRQATSEDTVRYQTVWAKHRGSVAAPTAGLNMTEAAIDSLSRKGVQLAHLTLHVGLGTFLPIRTDSVEDHHMHEEYFEIPEKTVAAVQATRAQGRRIVALGTTVARTLEYAHTSFAEPPRDISGEADIFIYPGYQFQIIDGLLTNFHAPKSTVLMLAATFAGWELLHQAYEHAKAEQYRFLSYGDSMLIL